MSVEAIVITQNPVTSWEVFQRTLEPGDFLDYRDSIRAVGGFISASFRLVGDTFVLDEFYENGLGRHINTLVGGGRLAWEGFVYGLVYQKGSASPARVSYEKLANEMWMRYVSGGVAVRSGVFLDAASQARHGRKQLPIQGGEPASAVEANQAVQTYLKYHLDPSTPAVTLNFGGKSAGARAPASLTVECRGYWETLNWRVFNSLSPTGNQDADLEVAEIVGKPAIAGLLPSTNLKAYWKLDEVSTGAAAVQRNDSKGTNHLTDNNTVPSIQGQKGRAVLLALANSESLSVPDNANLSTGDVHFLWAGLHLITAKPGTNMVLAGKGAALGVTTTEWALYWVTGTDRFRFFVSNGVATSATVDSSFAPVTNRLYGIIVWHDPVANTINMRVFDQNVDYGTTSAAFSAGSWDSTEAFRIGATNTPSLFASMVLDEAFFMKGGATEAALLSDAQMLRWWNNGQFLTYEEAFGRAATGVGQFIRDVYIPEKNFTKTPRVLDIDAKAQDIIVNIGKQGDSSYQRWNPGVGPDRTLYFKPAARHRLRL